MYHFVPSTYPVHPIIDGVSLRWTAAELEKVIAMLQNPEFDSKDIDPYLHQRMAKAVDDGRIKCFNLWQLVARVFEECSMAKQLELFCAV
jgi:hypothetical protein